jgi:threonine dehydrogenase-like Zn-dependent dehydrogenase
VIIGFNGFKADMPLYEQYHDGRLAEYIVVLYWLVDKLPEKVLFDVASKVHNLGSTMCALKCTNLEPYSTIIVTAATGVIGTLILKLTENFSISRVILIGHSKEHLEAIRHLTKVSTDIVTLDELD